MHLVKLTTAGIKNIFTLTIALSTYTFTIAQDNSPYSRYGLGDVLSTQNMVNRSMGGISAGYGAGYNSNPDKPTAFSLNFVNPASLGMVRNTILDLGGEVNRRTLKSNISPARFTSTNTVVSYLQFGVPIGTKKMEAKNRTWGASLGIRPVTRTNYKIEDNNRLSGVDSTSTTYEGSGGINQVSLSTGIRINNFSVGITGGYMFGSRDLSTRLSFINDSVFYYRSNIESKSTFGGGFLTAGMLYDIKTRSGILRLGAYANLQSKLKARQSIINETFTFNGEGEVISIDTVNFQPEISGDIIYPATYAIGFTHIAKRWLVGADVEMANWDNYRFYDTKDLVRSTYKIKAGVQYVPLRDAGSRRYLNLIQYRAGAFLGPDMVKIESNKRSEYGFTFGAGLPLTTQRFDNLAILNAGVEFASRGNKQSKSLRENVMRFTLGFSLNAVWFQKRKYD
ncbi:MAG: hypothetical protein WKF35_07610 [Ferruginibacter sp.]